MVFSIELPVVKLDLCSGRCPATERESSSSLLRSIGFVVCPCPCSMASAGPALLLMTGTGTSGVGFPGRRYLGVSAGETSLNLLTTLPHQVMYSVGSGISILSISAATCLFCSRPGSRERRTSPLPRLCLIRNGMTCCRAAKRGGSP